MIALLAGLLMEVAGATIDRHCGSSRYRAVHFGVQAKMNCAGEDERRGRERAKR